MRDWFLASPAILQSWESNFSHEDPWESVSIDATACLIDKKQKYLPCEILECPRKDNIHNTQYPGTSAIGMLFRKGGRVSRLPVLDCSNVTRTGLQRSIPASSWDSFERRKKRKYWHSVTSMWRCSIRCSQPQLNWPYRWDPKENSSTRRSRYRANTYFEKRTEKRKTIGMTVSWIRPLVRFPFSFP